MQFESNPPFWVRRITALFTIAVFIVVFIFFFNAITTIVLGVLAAAIVACALNPLVKAIPAPRALAAGIVGVGLIAGVAAMLVGLSLPLAAPMQHEIQRQLTAKNYDESKAKVDELLKSMSSRFHLPEPMSTDQLLGDLTHFVASDRSWLMLSTVRDALLAVLLWLAFVFVGSIFLLSSPRDVLLSPGLRTIPPAHRPNFRAMLDALGARLRWWLVGTLGGMLVVFTASIIGYSIAGLKFALPLALIAGLGEIVPTVGPAIAALVAILFAASQSGGSVIGVLITYAGIQSLEAYLILPLIMKGAVKIHPAVTLFSVIFWAKVFGLPGLMLAIPINLTLGSAVEYLYVRPREERDAAANSGMPPPNQPPPQASPVERIAEHPTEPAPALKR